MLGVALLAVGTVATLKFAGVAFDDDRISAQYGAYVDEVGALQTDIAHAHCTSQQRIYDGIGDAEVILSQLNSGAVPTGSFVYDANALAGLTLAIDAAVEAASRSAYSADERALADEYANVHGSDYDTCVMAVSEEFSSSLPRLVNVDSVQALLDERNHLTEELVEVLDSPPDERPQVLTFATDEVDHALGAVISSVSDAQKVRSRNWLAGTATVEHYRNVNSEVQAAYAKWQESRAVSDLVSAVESLEDQDSAYVLLTSSHEKGVSSSARVEWRQERLAEIRRAEEAERLRLAEEERLRLAEEERLRLIEEERLRLIEEERQREEQERNPVPTPTPAVPTVPGPPTPTPTPTPSPPGAGGD